MKALLKRKDYPRALRRVSFSKYITRARRLDQDPTNFLSTKNGGVFEGRLYLPLVVPRSRRRARVTYES
jgi:hypothetical protein